MTTNNSLQLPQHAPQAAPPLDHPTPEHVSPARALLSVVMVVLGSVVTTLDLQMTNPGLSQQIQGSLGFTADDSSWITVAYTSAELIAIPLTGWLSHTFSRRRYLSVNMAVFMCFSIACAMAWNLPSLIVFRTFLGLVSGTFIFSSFNAVLTQLPRAKQHIGFVMVSITIGLPIPIGQFLSGWITDNLSWHYIYYLDALLGLLVILGLRHWLDPEPMRLFLLKQIDWLGTIVLAIGLICLVVVLERGNTENWFDSHFIVSLGVISLAFLTLFCWIELQSSRPLIDLRLLGKHNFALINIFNAAYGFFLAYSSILPQYLTQIQGYNPVQVSAVLIWSTLVNPTLAKIIEHFDARLLIGVGTSLFVISCFMNSTLELYDSGPQITWSQIVRGLGQPLIGAVLSFAATDNIKKEQFDDVTAIYNLLRNIGTTIANASVGALLTKREQFHSNIIVDSVSTYNYPTQSRLQQLSQFFTSRLGDPSAAESQALQSIDQTVRQQAYIMAYSDCFYFIGIAVIVAVACSIPFLKKIKKPTDTVN